MTSLPLGARPSMTQAMRKRTPDDPSGRLWFNWPLALGLVVNVVLWTVMGALLLLLKRR